VKDSARNQVVINCEYREGGIGFTYLTDFSLSGITMINCGVLGLNRGFTHWNFSLTHFALHVALGFNVNLSFLFITNPTVLKLGCCALIYWVLQVFMTQ